MVFGGHPEGRYRRPTLGFEALGPECRGDRLGQRIEGPSQEARLLACDHDSRRWVGQLARHLRGRRMSVAGVGNCQRLGEISTIDARSLDRVEGRLVREAERLEQLEASAIQKRRGQRRKQAGFEHVDRTSPHSDTPPGRWPTRMSRSLSCVNGVPSKSPKSRSRSRPAQRRPIVTSGSV